jgi:hypothetical protein
LKGRAEQAAPETKSKANKQETSGGFDITDILLGGGSSKRQGVLESAAKSAARSIGQEVGRQLIRGVLGSLLGGGRKR